MRKTEFRFFTKTPSFPRSPRYLLLIRLVPAERTYLTQSFPAERTYFERYINYVLRPSNRIHARSHRAADCGVVHLESPIAANSGLYKSLLETDLRRETAAFDLAALSALDVAAAAAAVVAADRTRDC